MCCRLVWYGCAPGHRKPATCATSPTTLSVRRTSPFAGAAGLVTQLQRRCATSRSTWADIGRRRGDNANPLLNIPLLCSRHIMSGPIPQTPPSIAPSQMRGDNHRSTYITASASAADVAATGNLGAPVASATEAPAQSHPVGPVRAHFGAESARDQANADRAASQTGIAGSSSGSIAVAALAADTPHVITYTEVRASPYVAASCRHRPLMDLAVCIVSGGRACCTIDWLCRLCSPVRLDRLMIAQSMHTCMPWPCPVQVYRLRPLASNPVLYSTTYVLWLAGGRWCSARSGRAFRT